jgi:putative endonuclease
VDKLYYVYLLASGRNGTLYVGVTSRLYSRVREHRDGLIEGFTKKYSVKRLVWFKSFDHVENAIRHEKRIKRWLRQWKIALIEAENPQWLDLYDVIET